MKLPKEKAEELIKRFLKIDPYLPNSKSRMYSYEAKQCTIICCEEIINSKPIGNSIKYYIEVIEEIKKL